MKISNNHYRLLYSENKKMLSKIFLYLNTHPVNFFCLISLKQDLIDIFIDNQNRNISPKYTLNNYKDFCDEIILNSLKRSKIESICRYLIIFFSLLFIIIPLLIIFSIFEYNITFDNFFIKLKVYDFVNIMLPMLSSSVIVLIVFKQIFNKKTKFFFLIFGISIISAIIGFLINFLIVLPMNLVLNINIIIYESSVFLLIIISYIAYYYISKLNYRKYQMK